MFDVPPKCPALADKLTGIFGWRHTYRVSQKHKGLTHTYLQKSYSLTLPKRTSEFIKEPDSWVAVHHLQTQSGILDPDDRLNDVADDREQILASFEDAGPDPGLQQGGGDGASGSSSVGTGSPDIFRDTNTTDTHNRVIADNTTPHIEVTSTTTAPHTGLGLQVRRSSDPNLVQALKNQSETNKRWSAAAPASGSENPESILDNINHLSPQWELEDDEHYHSRQSSAQSFARSGRLSMQFLGDGNGYKWMEAAEKLTTQNYSTKSLPRETGKRKEPLGQAYESIREKDGEMLLIINEGGGPLGLTAVPDEAGGLLVQHVDNGSRAEKGRMRKGDRILEINGTKLVGLNDTKMQEQLRKSLACNELRVRVLRGNSIAGRNKKDTKIAEMIEAEEKSSTGMKVATVSPTRKVPGAPVATSLQVANTRKLGRKIEIVLKKGPHGLGFTVTSRDNPAGGHCPIYIKNILPKGAAIDDGRLKPGDRLLEVDGLPMTGKSQSDVVSVLRATQPGASVTLMVSRQQELAEVGEREINHLEEPEEFNNRPPKPPAPVLPPSLSKSQNLRTNDVINTTPAKLNHEQNFIDAGSESATSTDSLQSGGAVWRNREMLTLHIPVYDTEKAGLGVSVKGKTTSANSSNGSNNSARSDGDLGIFVKNVLHGGAASRDGRLRMNDQLLSINGISLLGQSNADAMETLRRAMIHTTGNIPGVITLSIARKVIRPYSTSDLLDQHDSSNASENSGKTVIYLSPDKKENKDNLNRWSNPVLDRLTGGVCSNSGNKRPSPLLTHGLRNESYYMATNDTWSPALNQQMHHMNHSVLIEDDPEPMSPTIPPRPTINSVTSPQSQNSSQVCDATYSSQLSLETNNSAEAFSRDAVGRRSISEKHHAALDARETGTYQRNKKLRDEREKERRLKLTKSAIITGSVESLARLTAAGASIRSVGHRSGHNDLNAEALDKIGDLGPSLGMKKSSSLESLQTMVQEIQMSDEPRGGPSALRAPRGRGREENLRAAVADAPDGSKPRKHWLLEDGDVDGGFINRHSPFQSSLSDGKNKNRAKKPGLLKGIGHMFRFGKHRKDGVMPTETVSEFGAAMQQSPQPPPATPQSQNLPERDRERPKGGPPGYQPPPPPSNLANNGIQQNDIFNHRYQHYVNYEEIHNPPQPQIRTPKEELSESTLESMRRQVMRQRNKVEEESRRHQHYHSQRSTRTETISNTNIYHTQQHHKSQIQTRPASNYYEYDTIKLSSPATGGPNDERKSHAPSPSRQWKSATLNGMGSVNGGGSGRHRGPFITQVQIRDQTQNNIGAQQITGNQQPQQQSSNNHGYYHRHQSSQPQPQPHASRV